jgi:hypothetical protein
MFLLKITFVKINMLDTLSSVILMRSLFLFLLIEKGWTIRKTKNDKNTYIIYKSIKKNS